MGLSDELGDDKKRTVTKSELIERIAEKQSQLAYKDVELAVKSILEHMAQMLATGERIEIHRLREFLSAPSSRAGGPQSEDRRTGLAARQVRAALQARQGTA